MKPAFLVNGVIRFFFVLEVTSKEIRATETDLSPGKGSVGWKIPKLFGNDEKEGGSQSVSQRENKEKKLTVIANQLDFHAWDGSPDMS